MKLAELREKYGIKRIDFNKVQKTGFDETYNDDKLECPYCKYVFDFEGEETGDILKGEPYQCPECEKWFYTEGEMYITTTCTPIEDYVLCQKSHIETAYKHLDKCEEKGADYGSPYGCEEWDIYKEYARPLFENMEANMREDMT